MEDLLVKIAGVVRSEKLCLERKAVVVFCADNGVVAEGVTQTGSEVTAVVTENIARGIASVNRMASVAGADVIPIDGGVKGRLQETGIRNCRIADGTANLLHEPAMTMEQTLFNVAHVGGGDAHPLRQGFLRECVGLSDFSDLLSKCVVVHKKPA